MLIQTQANINVIEEYPDISGQNLELFFRGEENEILELHQGEQVLYYTKHMLLTGQRETDLRICLDENVFLKARMLVDKTGLVLLTDQEGNVVSALHDVPTYYNHLYCYDGGLDMSFLNRYDSLVLSGVNEYSVELFLTALRLWSGKKVILCGGNWELFLPVLPSYPGLEIIISTDAMEELVLQACNDPKTAIIGEFLPKNEPLDRYHQDFFCYDEVMFLTFLFADRRQLGTKNTSKPYFVIDGFFAIEGIYAICMKVFTVAKYALRKGFIPVFRIVSSYRNIYSDFPGDEIWEKFFCQPDGNTLEDVMQSRQVTFSPNANVLNVLRYIMEQEYCDTNIIWVKGMLNQRVEQYIQERRFRFLPEPASTLGVLIRGTDYTKTAMPGHSRHASPKMVIEKIMQVEKERGCFSWIYLSTEDEDVYQEMKEAFRERLLATDQERFCIQEGELLVDLHQNNRQPGKGFRLGVEYLCTIQLLSECDSLIASGGCGGTSEAIRLNAGRYRYQYVFDLGINPN